MEEISAKVVLLGDTAVGKTSIAVKYVSQDFDEKYKPTIGASFLPKTTEYNGHTFDLAIWDTAGQEVYRTLTPIYYRDANMALIVFALDRKESFDSLDEWIQNVRSANDNVSIVIIGNKSDLDEARQISLEMGMKKAQSLEVPYIETSALTGSGIEAAFEELLSQYLKNNENHVSEPETVPVTVSLTPGPAGTNGPINNKGKKCC